MRARVAGITGQEPSSLFRISQLGGVKHHALEIVKETVAVDLHQCVGMGGGLPKLLFGGGQVVRLAFHGPAGVVLDDEQEIAVVGDENLAVFAEVAGDLGGVGRHAGVVLDLLALNDAAGRRLTGERFIIASLELVGRIKAAVWHSGALILQAHHATDARFERLAGGVE
jgi:hypothetical protein